MQSTMKYRVVSVSNLPGLCGDSFRRLVNSLLTVFRSFCRCETPVMFFCIHIVTTINQTPPNANKLFLVRNRSFFKLLCISKSREILLRLLTNYSEHMMKRCMQVHYYNLECICTYAQFCIPVFKQKFNYVLKTQKSTTQN